MKIICPYCGSSRVTCWKIDSQEFQHCICYDCNEEWVE